MTETLSKIDRVEPVRLQFNGGMVLVMPEDQDKFIISSNKAIEACRLMDTSEKKYASFKEDFLMPLHEWCERHKDKVTSCYAGVPQSEMIPVFVVGKNEQYDFDLVSELAQMDIKLQANQWNAICHQLPAGDLDTLATFFDPSKALEIYAQFEATQ